jgi:YD repeat-containing protein
MTDPSGTTGYEYDNRGDLWKLTNPVNEVTEWLYGPAGRLSQRKLGNATWEEVSYDSRSRVTGIALKKPGATLRQLRAAHHSSRHRHKSLPCYYCNSSGIGGGMTEIVVGNWRKSSSSSAWSIA